MPRKAIDYSKSLVYKICKDNETLYIGSTTNLASRKSQHKSNCKNPNSPDYDKLLYQNIRADGGWTKRWVIVMVQAYPECKNANELLMFERQHYDRLNPPLNVNRPCLYEGEAKEYKAQYYVENAETIKQNNAQYYVENAETIKQNNAQYRIENAETIKQNNARYYVENADTIKQNKAQYYVENADKIKQYHADNAERLNAKNTCQCGGKYTTQNKAQHKKGKKHIKYCELVQVQAQAPTTINL